MPDQTPDRETVRRAIEAQLCPFCGRGPFKVLAQHTLRAHAVDKLELRDMAGLDWQASICAAEVSASARERGLRNDMSRLASKKRAPKRFTEAGKISTRKSLRSGSERRKENIRAENDLLVRRFSEYGSDDEAIRKLASEHGTSRKTMRQRLKDNGCEVPDSRPLANDRRRRVSGDERQQIAQLYRQGMSQSQIGERFGIHQSHVSTILRQDGVPTREFHRRSRMEYPTE